PWCSTMGLLGQMRARKQRNRRERAKGSGAAAELRDRGWRTGRARGIQESSTVPKIETARNNFYTTRSRESGRKRYPRRNRATRSGDFRPRPQGFRHGPGLGEASARGERRIAVENFAERSHAS